MNSTETEHAIAVLGSGVAGLTTALTLSERGRRAVVYTDPVGSPPASGVAPALFTPYQGPDSVRFRARTEVSLTRLRALARSHPIDSGVRFGKLREYFYKPHVTHPWLEEMLGTRRIAPVPAPCVDATEDTRPHVDMLVYLPWLESEVARAGVRFVERRVRSFEEVFGLGHKKIVNCAGLGARLLTDDPLLKPMHGQVLHVPNDIGLTYSLHDDAPGGRVAYVFVFRDRLVLGGTFESGRTDARTDPAELDAIVERCRGLLRLDGFPRWDDLARARGREMAAARPTRGPGDVHEQTRVELEPRENGRAIVHNYGHGRTGVTLSWGTATEVADMLTREQ
ncbi:MAG: FAD-dependent oxidoreductase [Phycisphaerae bacterium]|nr:FAD-dependent oxidoreductase [Phycisphaerae bacterium]